MSRFQQKIEQAKEIARQKDQPLTPQMSFQEKIGKAKEIARQKNGNAFKNSHAPSSVVQQSNNSFLEPGKTVVRANTPPTQTAPTAQSIQLKAQNLDKYISYAQKKTDEAQAEANKEKVHGVVNPYSDAYKRFEKEQENLQKLKDERANLTKQMELQKAQAWEQEQYDTIMRKGGAELMTLLKQMNQVGKTINGREFGYLPEEERLQTAQQYRDMWAQAERFGLEEKETEQLLDYIIRLENAQAYDKTMREMEEASRGVGGAIGMTAASVPMNLASGAGAVDIALQNLQRKLSGSDTPIDYKTQFMQASGAANTIRETVTEQIDSDLGKFAYQTGTSMLDSAGVLGLTAMGIPHASALLGGSAATNAMVEAKERGATDEQALGIGLLSGVAESVFEKYSLESLIKLQKPTNIASAIKNILKQFFTEGSEEVNTSIANMIADTILMGDLSAYETMKREYRESGMSMEDAEKAAARDWAQQILLDFLGGAASGGIFGAGANVATRANMKNTGDAFRKLGSDVTQAIIDTGLESPEGTESNTLAKKLSKKIESGVNITSAELGGLYEANVEQINKEQEQSQNEPQTALQGVTQETKNAAPLTGTANVTEGTADENQRNDVLAGSSERTDGPRTGIETRQLAESTGQTERTGRQVDQLAERFYLEDQARAAQVRRTSAQEQGIKDGTARQSFQVVPKEIYTVSLKEAEQVLMQAGASEVRFTLGKIEVINPTTKKPVSVPAMVQDGIVWVQANNGNRTVTQLAKHEAYHLMADSDPYLNIKLKQQIIDTYSEEEMDNLIGDYIAAYDGIYGLREEDIGRYVEEILADAYAGMSRKTRYGTTLQADKYTDLVQSILDQTVAATERKTGPPRYSYLDTEEDSGYNWRENDGGEKDGREMGDDPYRRISQKMPGKQTTSGDGTYREVKENVYGEGGIEGDGRKSIQRRDSEGRRLTPEQFQKIQGTAIKDENGAPLVVYHFTPEMQFEAFEKGDIGFHFGTKTAASDRMKAKETERGRLFRAYLNIKNPYYVRVDLIGWNANQIGLYLWSEGLISDAQRAEIESIPGIGYDSPGAKKVRGILEKLGFDGIEYQNYIEGNKSEKSYIAFRDEQIIKTEITPIHGRFSMDEEEWTSRLQQAERVTNQREEMKHKDERATIAKKDLRKQMLQLFSIPDGQKAEIGAIIDNYADRLIKNKELTQADRNRFFDRMYQEGVMTVPAEEYAAEARSVIKGSRVYVNDQIKADFGDDWNSFRKRAFAAGIYLTSDRSRPGVDVWSRELSEYLPGVFERDVTDGRYALENIVATAEEGKDLRLTLAEYAAMEAGKEFQTEEDFANYLEQQMDWMLETFAQKAELELKLKKHAKDQLQKEQERYQQMTVMQRAKIKLKEQKEKDERREKTQRQKAARELREMQQKTLKSLQWLSKNQYRAPEELKQTWDEVLGDIDIIAINAADEMRYSKKYDATWKDIKEMYLTAQSYDPNFLPSKELDDIVKRLSADKIADFDMGALQDLYKAAVGLRTEFYNRNNVIEDEKMRLFSEVYSDSTEEIKKAPGGYKGTAADEFFNKEQLTPMNVLERMAGWNKNGAWYSMAKQLEKGEQDVNAYYVKANGMLADWLKENEDWVRKADGQGKDAIWYELELPDLEDIRVDLSETSEQRMFKPVFGKKIKVYMTPSQKIHMYLESKGYENLRHMEGGRTFANKELYSKGKREEAFAQGTTVRLAPETVKRIVSDLTQTELELAGILERYYNEFAKGEINRVSNILYGYDKAVTRNYAPVYTNQNYTNQEIGRYDATAEGVGNLKSRKFAKNPSYNIGAFDAFEKHVSQTSRFVGMAIPARNWSTLLNWQVRGDSMKETLTQKWGEASKNYITNMLTDLQSGKKVEEKSIAGKTIDKLFGNYISAVFGANPSIVLKQLGSLPLASAYLGTANTPSPGQIARIDRDLISKYTSLLDYRLKGYATPETKYLKENPNWAERNKILRFVFGGGSITAMDGAAASMLWPWAENKVRKEQPDLEVGTKAQVDAGQSPFYQAVAKEFETAVLRSQSVSDYMHQGTLRKAKDPISKALTMFKSDSSQIYNALRQKIGEAKYIKREHPEDKAAIRKANKEIGATILSSISGFMWAELITLLVALWKNKGKKYRDEDGELTAQSIAMQVAGDLTGDLFGVVAGGEELAEIIGNVVTGDKWYGIDTPGLEQLTSMLEEMMEAGRLVTETVSGAANIAANGGDMKKYFADRAKDLMGGAKQIAQTASTYLVGVPASNVEAYLLGLVSWIAPDIAVQYEDLTQNAKKSDLDGMEGKALAQRVEDILARQISDDTADVAAPYLAALYEAGHKRVISSGVPNSITVKDESVKLQEYQKQQYEKVWKQSVGESLQELVKMDAFTKASAKDQEKVVAKIYEYASQRAKENVAPGYEVEKWVNQTQERVSKGESLAEVLLWNTLAGGAKDQFAKLQEAGMDEEEALQTAQMLSDLEPEAGAKSVSNVQKFEAILESALSEGEKEDALSTVLTESVRDKLDILKNYDGVTYEAYATFKVNAKKKYPEEKSLNQKEVGSVLKEMEIPNAAKAALWQMITGSKSDDNNPFSRNTGRQVIRDLGLDK